ncbi:hypothetical protein RHMOL_Rhmol08G0132600 [Rhododendron molle]|uniref:Uncharacterized protein n=1 Tax=Rhododendron molle TaxID=49168 RepID=A0ACC0MN17_RHOML|nr:hypothetical protein RHMOL_Rhmol08G0132600 [Rhododendron molle]
MNTQEIQCWELCGRTLAPLRWKSSLGWLCNPRWLRVLCFWVEICFWELCEQVTLDRAQWRKIIHVADPK